MKMRTIILASLTFLVSVVGGEGDHEADILSNHAGPAVIPFFFDRPDRLPFSAGDSVWLQCEYRPSPDGPTIHFEVGEKVWWLQEMPVLFLGSSGLALPDSLSKRTTAYLHISYLGKELPGSPFAISPRQAAIRIVGDQKQMAEQLAKALSTVDALYLAQVTNFLANNLTDLNVQGTRYSVSGFGEVINSDGQWVGRDISASIPRERAVSFGPWDFHSADQNLQRENTEGVYFADADGVTGFIGIFAPVHLPDLAEVTILSVRFQDLSSSIGISCALKSYIPFLDQVVELAKAQTGLSETGASLTKSDESISSPVISNDDRFYYLEVRVFDDDTWPPDWYETLKLKYVRIFYRLNSRD